MYFVRLSPLKTDERCFLNYFNELICLQHLWKPRPHGPALFTSDCHTAATTVNLTPHQLRLDYRLTSTLRVQPVSDTSEDKKSPSPATTNLLPNLILRPKMSTAYYTLHLLTLAPTSSNSVTKVFFRCCGCKGMHSFSNLQIFFNLFLNCFANCSPITTYHHSLCITPQQLANRSNHSLYPFGIAKIKLFFSLLLIYFKLFLN